MESFEESDQLPEDAPPEQVVDDEPGDAREDVSENAGGADDGDPGQATGHPENAG